MPPKNLSRWIIGALLLVAMGLALYFTIYVWRRIDKKQNDQDSAVIMNKGDFNYFYGAAKAMREGQDIYATHVDGPSPTGYIYPPLIAYLYQPLTKLPINSAARVSLLVNVAALAGALAIMARALLERLGRRHDWGAVLAVAVFAALLSTDKIKGELQMLQTNALVALAVAVALWQLDKKPRGFFWTGTALGFAINIKYQALALVFYLLFRRRWKALGASIGWTVAWGLLPAASVGWAREVAYLKEGFAGLLRVVGVHIAGSGAQMPTVASELSVSITSAWARYLAWSGTTWIPLLCAAGVGVAWLLMLYLLYRARGVKAIAWPNEVMQAAASWKSLVGMEWIAVVATVLAFSPQTNTRHLVLTTLIMVLGLVLLAESRGSTRWVVAAAMMILWMGLNLPAGRRDNPSEEHAVIFWHGIGGPAWTVLIAMAMLTWAGLKICGKSEGTAMTTPVAPPPLARPSALDARITEAV